MKKKVFSIMLVICLVLSVFAVGCGKDAGKFAGKWSGQYIINKDVKYNISDIYDYEYSFEVKDDGKLITYAEGLTEEGKWEPGKNDNEIVIFSGNTSTTGVLENGELKFDNMFSTGATFVFTLNGAAPEDSSAE